MIIYKKIAKRMPDLEHKLRQAKISDAPEEYVKRTVFLAVMLSFSICGIAFLFIQKAWLFLFIPVIMLFSFFYFIRYVDINMEKLRKEVNKEIVYAGRFLIIEIESGVPIYDAFRNIGNNYDAVGKFFGDVVRDVDFGTTLEEALENSIQNTPSSDLRKILWQVLNSLRTGSDIQYSLNAVLDQIVREQQIEVKEYGRKLNPMAMFYMMAAIIVPSLGTTMLVVMATFVGIELPLVALLTIVVVLCLIQFMFLAFIKSQRPAMAL